eukprot:6753464-Prymnesium_polylepis.2
MAASTAPPTKLAGSMAVSKFENSETGSNHCGGPFSGLYSRSEPAERLKRSHQLDFRCRRLSQQSSRVQPTEGCRNVDRAAFRSRCKMTPHS